MKGIAVALCALFSLVIVSGCATAWPVGSVYTKVGLPVTTGEAKGMDLNKMKKGESESKSILALVALGDSSIEAAARQGNIKTIYFVDWQAENILGIIGTYHCTVYGE